MVVAAPPGSVLDGGRGATRGGLVGAVLAVGILMTRSMRRGWRIAVTRCDDRGRTKGATHRERVADEMAAEARMQAILDAVRGGAWPDRSNTETDQSGR
jgi:hypothetical protein